MSQGHKPTPEPQLFVPAGEIYGHIPKSHFYERLDRVLDLSFVYGLTEPLYAPKLGRPSLDPVVFFKCMLVGFFENIVADMELEFRLADSLVLRRFLGYGLEERTPDESTLRKTRARMPEEAFRRVFDYVLDLVQRQGLVRGRALGTDSTVVEANASMESLTHRELGSSYEEYVLALRRQDKPEASFAEAVRADRDRPGKASNRDWESATDPEARIAQHPNGATHLSYKIDATVDLETGVIVAAGAETADLSDQLDCLERIDEAVAALEQRGITPVAVVADKGHDCGENLAELEARGLVPLISMRKATDGAPGFRHEDFTYEAPSDTLTCPAGQRLRRFARHKAGSRHYRAKASVCRSCPHFGVCTKNQKGRGVALSPYDEQVQANRRRVHSETVRPLLQIRRQRGEAPFAYFKAYGGLRRLAGRGLAYAAKKTLVAALGWNLLLILKALGRGAGASEPLGRLVWRLLAGLGAFWDGANSPKPPGAKRRSLRPAFLKSPARRNAACQNTPLSGGC